jgi:hypothetical protein
MNTARQATQNMEYVRRLLEDKQAGSAASAELTVSVIRLAGRPAHLALCPHRTKLEPSPQSGTPGGAGRRGTHAAVQDADG